jgi:hypothetical protein
VEEATRLRAEISTAEQTVPDAQLREKLDRADEALRTVRLVADLIVGTFFESDRPKQREDNRVRRFAQLQGWLTRREAETWRQLSQTRQRLLSGERPLTPFTGDRVSGGVQAAEPAPTRRRGPVRGRTRRRVNPAGYGGFKLVHPESR